MKKVCIIGNNGSNRPLSDGGSLKIRLFHQLLLEEGFDSYIVDLDGWKKHAISIIFKIKKAIKAQGYIVIMAGPKGCRAIIPLANFFNKKNSAQIVFCPLGIGTLDKLLKNKSPTTVNEFISNNVYGKITDFKMGKQLNKIDYVVVGNNKLKTCYEKFYNINNVVILNNFRIIKPDQTISNKTFAKINMIYCSRVVRNKGILDLIEVIKNNKEICDSVDLDIYGDNQLLGEDKTTFFELLQENIVYRGVVERENIWDVLRQYNLFCLPTKYYGEGTSGSLIEAMLVGVTPLVSSYSQAREIIEDGKNGFIFEINNVKDLENKLLYIIRHKDLLSATSLNASKSSLIYTYEYNRDNFLKFIGGKQ